MLDKIKIYVIFFPEENEAFVADTIDEALLIAERAHRVLGYGKDYIIKEF